MTLNSQPPSLVRYKLAAWVGKIFVSGVLLLFSLVCLVPLLLVVSASFTTDEAIFKNGYTLLPTVFSTSAYRFVLGDPTQILRAYLLTAFVATIGTIIGLTISAMLDRKSVV